jgi:hypothetical protein
MTLTQTTRPASALAALAILAMSSVPAAPAPISAGKASYDGTWSVLIVTQQGKCDRAYRYPVRISNGSVGYAGEASFNVSGSVGANGAVIVTVSRGSQSAKGTGRMSETDGSGTWVAGSGDCSGTWTAERRSKVFSPDLQTLARLTPGLFLWRVSRRARPDRHHCRDRETKSRAPDTDETFATSGGNERPLYRRQRNQEMTGD